jgi:pimeloyl-ACP methyl ester carboxylesterase
MQEHRIETLLGTLAAYELGDVGNPAVVLWPSLYCDHRSWLPIAQQLAKIRRCILLDGPGHGRSPTPARRYTLADCARATEQVLDALGVGTVDWLGNAWGGHVGVLAAVGAPSRVRALTAIGAPMQALEPAMRRKSLAGLALLRVGARGLVGNLVAKAMVSSSPSARDYIRECIRSAPKGGIELAVRSVSLDRPDLRPQLPAITVPTLFIAGGDDAMWPPAMARAQAQLTPGARVEVIPGAAHLAPLERVEETLAAIWPRGTG